MMTLDEAILYIRQDLRYAELVRDGTWAWISWIYLSPRRESQFFAEFSEVQKLVGSRGQDPRPWGGNGIASRAFARRGAKTVYAVEPDPSNEAGRSVRRRLAAGLPIKAIEAYGEEIPLPDGEADVVYSRQVLHHTTDLSQALRECTRLFEA